MTTLLTVYLAGVIVGLLAVDDRPAVRLVLALLWPVGPAAFVIVVTGLALVAVVLWPLRLIPVIAVLGALASWILGAP
jgi:hypothetical protein